MQVRLDRKEIEEAVTGYIDLMYSTPVEISDIQLNKSGTSILADVQFIEETTTVMVTTGPEVTD